MTTKPTNEQSPQGQENESGKRLKIGEEFIRNVDGNDFIIFEGLLDLAHKVGLSKLEVELVQIPSSENNYTAICRATAISRRGDIFVDYGEATPLNCDLKVSKHLISMSSTRAKARALRSFDNVGMTCIEELGDLNDVIGEESGNGQNKSQQRQPSSQKQPVEKSQPTPAPTTESPQAHNKAPEEKKNETSSQKTPSSTAESVPAMSAAQRRAVINISKRRGIQEDQLESMVNENFHIPFDQLSSRDASIFIKQLQQAA